MALRSQEPEKNSNQVLDQPSQPVHMSLVNLYEAESLFRQAICTSKKGRDKAKAVVHPLLRILDHRYMDWCISAVVVAEATYSAARPNLPGWPMFIFFIIFASELILKMIGNCINKTQRQVFLRRPSTWLDIFINLTTLCFYIVEWSGMTVNFRFDGFRALRLLRIPLLITFVTGVNTLVKALTRSAKPMAEVMLLSLVWLFMFALVGLQLFMGKFKRICVAVYNDTRAWKNDTSSWTNDGNDSVSSYVEWISNQSNWEQERDADGNNWMCGNATGARHCRDNYVCLELRIAENPFNGYLGFDDFGQSVLCAFHLVVMNKWDTIFAKVVAATGPLSTLFFVFILLFGTYQLLNAMLAVICVSYEKERAELSSESCKEQDSHNRKFSLIAYTAAQQNERFDAVTGARHEIMMSVPEKQSTAKGRFIEFRGLLVEAVQHPVFEGFIIGAVLLNTLVLSIHHYGMSAGLARLLDKSNAAFSAMYGLEIVMKVTVLGLDYFRVGWNWIDFIVTICIVINILAHKYFSGISVLRLLCLLRIIKLRKVWKTMRDLVETVASSVSTNLKVLVLMAFVFTSFALLGLVFLGDAQKLKPKDSTSSRLTFADFPHSLMTVVSIALGEYTEALWTCFESEGNEKYKCTLIITSAFIFGNFMILNLFVSILLSSFSDNASLSATTEAHDKEQPKLQIASRRCCCSSISCVAQCVQYFTCTCCARASSCCSRWWQSKNTYSRPRENCNNSAKERDSQKFSQLPKKVSIASATSCDSDASTGQSGQSPAVGLHAQRTSYAVRAPAEPTVLPSPEDEDFIAAEPLWVPTGQLGRTSRYSMSRSQSSQQWITVTDVVLHEPLQHVDRALEQESEIAVDQLSTRSSLSVHSNIPAKMDDALSWTDDEFATIIRNPFFLKKDPIVFKKCKAVVRGTGKLRQCFKPRMASIEVLEVAARKKMLQKTGMKLTKMRTASNPFGKSGSTSSVGAAAVPTNASDVSTETMRQRATENAALSDAFRACRACQWHKAASTLITLTAFEICSLLIVLFSTVLLCMDDAYIHESPALYRVVTIGNLVVTALFGIDAIIHFVGMGAKAYFSDGWCVTDLGILVVTVGDHIAQQYDISALDLPVLPLRMLRAIRLVRVIPRIEGTKIAVNALLKAIPSIGNVMILCVIFLYLFAILGTHLFGGMFWQCVDHQGDPINATVVAHKNACISSNLTWQNKFYNFDNVGEAALSLLGAVTLDNWLQIKMSAEDATAVDMQPLPEANYYKANVFFLTFIILGSLFMWNLFIGTIIEHFQMLRKKYEGSYVEAFLTKKQIEYYNLMKTFARARPNSLVIIPKTLCRNLAYRLLKHDAFELCILLLIAASTSMMCFEHYDMAESLKTAFAYADAAFTAAFIIEAALKLTAFSLHYFSKLSNVTDFCIVIMNVCAFVLWLLGDAAMPYEQTAQRVLRLTRIFRLYRIFKFAKGLQTIMFAMWLSLPALLNIGSLMLLVMVAYAIIGLHAFREAELTEMLNFRTIGSSIMVMLCMTTGGWTDVLEALSTKLPGCGPVLLDGVSTSETCRGSIGAIVFCVSYVIVQVQVIVNAYIAAVLENFTEQTTVGIVTDRDLVNFYKTWSVYDPHATQFIDYCALSDFLDDLRPPLGIKKPNGIAQAILNLPVVEGMRLHCLDVIMSLVKFNMGGCEDLDDLPDSMAKKVIRAFRIRFPELVKTDIVTSTREIKIRDYASRRIQKCFQKYVAQLKQERNTEFHMAPEPWREAASLHCQVGNNQVSGSDGYQRLV